MMFEQSEHIVEKAFLVSEQLQSPAFQLSEALVDKLLDKLSSDNEFREVFQRSPRIALAYLGHEAATNANLNDQGTWSCFQCKELASPEAIKASRDELRRQLLASKAVLNPIRLQA